MESLTNLLAEPRFVCRRDRDQATSNLSASEFCALQPSSLRPLAPVPAWVGKQAREGLWWFSGIEQHVTFASTWERDVLVLLDYLGDVVDAVRDPVIILPSRGSENPPLRPWLMVRSTGGDLILAVRRSDQSRATAVARTFGQASLDLAIPTLPPDRDMQVLRWLAGYRFTRFRLPPDAEQVVRDACSIARTLAWTVATVASATGYDQSIVRGNVFAQLWLRTIALVDTGRRLSNSSLVCAS